MAEEDLENKDYPMPEKSKPLKIGGAELDSIILVPKGVKADKPQEENAKQKETKEEDEKDKEAKDQLSSELDDLQGQLNLSKTQKEELVDKVARLEAELSDIREAVSVELATKISKIKVGSGIISKDKVKESTESLRKLDNKALRAMLTEIEPLADKIKTPVPERNPKSKLIKNIQLSDAELEKEKFRAKLGITRKYPDLEMEV